MNFILSPTLSQAQSDDILNIYRSADFVSIEQFPGFSIAAEPGLTVFYFLAYHQNELCGYACVNIKKRVLASVQFGPVVKNASEYEKICKGLISKCRSKGILVLRLSPPYMNDADKTALETTTSFAYENSDEEINWCTQTLSLDQSMEEILKNFRNDHRQSIKKSIKLELKPVLVTDREWIKIFSAQHSDMYEKRGLNPDRAKSLQRFLSLFDFFEKTGLGYFVVILENDKIIGGVCCVIDGSSVRYQDGYSHPDYRKYPVTHAALYEAIKIAKERGLKYFDFGGYANNVKEGDQLYAINMFKDGFGGKLIIYPLTMLIFMFPFAKALYKLYRRRTTIPK